MKKKYIITDSCCYYPKKGKKRVPHAVEVVDLETGTVKLLRSGSIIQIVRAGR